ncbi:MAG: hypothetical protein QJR03_06990 [Sphaerobacter sp.]|nr:hypothetical protein [Sphaerobacter sp.]
MGKQVIALLVITLIGVSLLPVQHADGPTFANPAFQNLWSARSRSPSSFDLWGSEPLAWRVEPYADAPGGRHIVQYFDRGRMELTLPRGGGDPTVSQGLLALELTTGHILLGDTLTAARPSPAIPIDSGAPDDRVPTYAALSHVVGRPAPSHLGAELPVAWIDSRGQPEDRPPVVTLRAADYIEETGHNLPDITVAFFDRHPFGTITWIEAMGYPISEPYWTIYRRDGLALPSLVQVFERRILVYTPGLQPERRFTTANTGRHYYRWRYDADPPRRWPDPHAGPDAPSVAVPAGFADGVYARDLGTPVGLALGPAGNLWIVTAEGRVLSVERERADGTAADVNVFAEGLPNPRGIAIVGTTVYVAVDNGVLRLDDGDLDGVADRTTYLTRAIDPAPGPLGTPAVDARGRVFVAGAHVASRQSRVVAQIDTDGALRPARVGLANPGPLLVAHQQLLVVDRPSGGQHGLYQVPIDVSPLVGSDTLGPTPNRLVARFPPDMTVHAVLRFDSGLWPGVEPDTLFAAVSTDRGASLVRTVPHPNGQPPEIVEFATGFSQPVALAAGLDGALYVADAGRGEVIKIVATPARP